MKQLLGVALKRFVRQQESHGKELVLIAENIQYPTNVGSLLRIADAVGLKHLYLTGVSKTPDHSKVREVGRKKHRVVAWTYERDTMVVIEGLKKQGYRICALELTDESVEYHTYRQDTKVAIVVGSEVYGVTRKTLALCDDSVYIPMYGKGKSLNVHVAAAVFLYHLVGK